MRPIIAVVAATVALLSTPLAGAAVIDEGPLGEPLHLAAAKFGLSDADVAFLHAAGGEFACPGDRQIDGARLNGWLISDHAVITNAHSIIEGEEKPGHPYLRQPIAGCSFTSFRELGADRHDPHVVDLNGLGAVLRRGAEAPVDPTNTVSGDVVKFNLKHPVASGVPLAFDPTPVAKGDGLILISRVPTAYQTAELPGDDLLIEKCTVTSLDPVSPSYPRGAVAECNGAPGMSAGVLFTRAGDKLVAKGFLVSLEYVRQKGTKDEKLVGAHILLFDDKFQKWLGGSCAFWPAELRIPFCGVKP